VSLIILVYEIRDNTESNRALIYGQEIDRLNSLRFAELNNPVLTDLTLVYRSGDLSKLSEAQTSATLACRLTGCYMHKDDDE
jgi:hypothetical protein